MAEKTHAKDGRLLFTKRMKKEYTILAPMMSPVHFGVLERVFAKQGYNFKLLNTTHSAIVRTGLQNVHNDTCYPALLVVGQLLEAIQSGEYDTDKLAILMTQTGGGCRASNYIHLIRRALRQNGYEHIPVISMSATSLEKNPGFRLSLRFLAGLIYAVEYGDALMLLANQTRPYEVTPGETDALVAKWTNRLNRRFADFLKLKKNLNEIVRDFAKIPLRDERKVRVGIVGEIYVKYAPLGNNNLEQFLLDEGAEPVVPSLMDFLLYCCNHRVENSRLYGMHGIKQIGSWFGEKYLLRMQNMLIRAVRTHSNFRPPAAFLQTKQLIKGYIGGGNKMGEGWLLTAEMLELIHAGTDNVICTQPFGCLPNHIAGKGMLRRIRQMHPQANIIAIDYDPGATRINQENRIKLMLAVAREHLAEQRTQTTTPQTQELPQTMEPGVAAYAETSGE